MFFSLRLFEISMESLHEKGDVPQLTFFSSLPEGHTVKRGQRAEPASCSPQTYFHLLHEFIVEPQSYSLCPIFPYINSISISHEKEAVILNPN